MASCTLTRPALLLVGRCPSAFRHGAVALQRAQVLRAGSAAFSTSGSRGKDYKLVIVGGGAAGSAIANRFVYRMGKHTVAVVEPSPIHYYQAMWTLVGGGLKQFKQTVASTDSILPSGCTWIQDKATIFDPANNTITTAGGEKIHYEYLVVAMGVQLDFDLIKGLPEALVSDPAVTSNYCHTTVTKTFPAMQALQGGNAIFTFPNKPIKCAGAPQKIMYLTDDHLRRTGRRDKVNLMYNTSLPVIFGIPKYAQALLKIVKERNIDVNFRHNLIEVISDKKEAVFELLDDPGKTVTFNYSMLHVGPPCSAPKALKASPLVDASGFVEVNKDTLQHTRFPNVFAIGDCTNAPTAKTAAAVAAQSSVVSKTIRAVMKNQPSTQKYDGYTSCPLVTKKGACIMAEFGYDGKVLETFPINQGKERLSMYYVKAHLLPILYWHGLVKGMWGGPSTFRKLLSLGTAK